MIEQYYYMGEIGTLFSQTGGSNIEVKTPLLKLDYIKKNIHPLCHYDISSELKKNVDADENKYPPNFLIFPTFTGELIVGQAIYKGKNLAGLGPMFFMHNFVLSENEKRRHLKEPEKLFGITGFITGYSDVDGRELPTLAAIPYERREPYFENRALLFSKLGMDEVLFYKLMYATFIVATCKKKIYIVLNVPIEELEEMAKALLYHLYLHMPWCVTEKLGVCTYSSKLETKKSMQITFLDQYTLRYDDKISKEFIFDFVNKKFLNVEQEMVLEPYMRICSQYVHNKLVWEKFNKWIDDLSGMLEDKSEKEIDYYSQVAILLDMSLSLKAKRDYDMTQSKVRKGLMARLLSEVKGRLSDEMKAELTQILEYAIDLTYERIGVGELYTKDEISALLDFKLGVNKGVLEQETHCIQIIVALLEIASREDMLSYAEELLKEVKYYPNTYIHLYEAIYKIPTLKQKIVYPMIDEQVKEVSTIEDLMSKMSELEVIEPILLLDNYYREKVCVVFDTCLHSVSLQLEQLLQVQKWCQDHSIDLYNELRKACENYFMQYMDLKEIDSEKTLCALQLTQAYPYENYEIIRDYQCLKTDLSFMSPEKIRVNTKVQELIKMLYKRNPKNNNFYMLIYAFLETESDGCERKVNLEELLSYLSVINLEIMLDFISWSKGQEVYIETSTFDERVINFLKVFKQKQGKIPKKLIKTKLSNYPKTKDLGDKILKAQRLFFLR